MRLEKTKAQKAHESRVFAFAKHEQKLLSKLGKKIRLDLIRTGKTVERLSIELGISRSTLREIIAGRSNARLTTLLSIAHGLGYKRVTEFIGSVE